ncbi:MAG: ferredoxin [Acidimicrobiia bacterium]
MRIVVDLDRCEGNGACEAFAPAVFRVDDHDVLEVLDPAPGESARPDVEAAVSACPKAALRIEP